jgi:hypothetical protein
MTRSANCCLPRARGAGFPLSPRGRAGVGGLGGFPQRMLRDSDWIRSHIGTGRLTIKQAKTMTAPLHTVLEALVR